MNKKDAYKKALLKEIEEIMAKDEYLPFDEAVKKFKL